MIRKLSRKVRGVGDEDQELTSARGVQDLTPAKSVHPEKVFVKRSSSARLQDPDTPIVPKSVSGVQRSTTMREDRREKKVSRSASSAHNEKKVCGVCYKELSGAKLLPCQHTFCCSCLIQYVNPKMLLDCPKCRNVVTVTPGLTNLPDYTPGARVEPGDNPVEIKQNQNCSSCYSEDINARPCLHCNKKYCSLCLDPHLNLLEEQKETMSTHLQETLESLAISLGEFKDQMSDIAVEADEAVEIKISNIQNRRSKLDEELCDLLNSKNVEMERLRNGTEKMIEKLGKGTDGGTQEHKMLQLKSMRGDYDKLIKDLEGFMADKIDIDTENITLVDREHGDKLKKGKTNVAMSQLHDVVKLTWSGCVQPSAAAECPWNGQVWVCATGCGEIGIFSQEGKLVNTIAHQGMLYPISIGFNITHREVYVADQRQQCIWIINGDTYTVLNSIGKENTKKGKMSSPSCLMVDLKQRIYLTNTGDTKIQVWNRSGEHVRNLGHGEDGLSGIRAPTAVSCSRSGRRIAVLDAGDMRVHVISTISWRSVFQLTGAEKILGLSWDKQDQILILLKDKIQVYDGTTLIKTEKIEPGASAISMLGEDIGLNYTHHVIIRRWKERK